MQEIEISSLKGEKILENLNDCLQGELASEWGEHTLTFDNSIGKGTIRSISFDWGMSLLDCKVRFNEDVKVTFKLKSISPIEFLFVSKGSVHYAEDDDEFVRLERYQNVIIAPKKFSKKRYMFPRDEDIDVNFIRIIKKDYFKKKNHNLTYLNDILLSVFNDTESEETFSHLGSYNLKIADEIKRMNISKDSGMARTLSLEGRLYLILAMQLMEHHNFENEVVLPESLSRSDIEKVHTASKYVVDNISDPITVATLSSHSGLSPKKLQLGFRLLYSKTVNEFVRQHKLEIARDFLGSTDLSISEIVYTIGFKSRSYFSKVFSHHYGLLPTEYRKKLKRVR